jgi:hypothetical protein
MCNNDDKIIPAPPLYESWTKKKIVHKIIEKPKATVFGARVRGQVGIIAFLTEQEIINNGLISIRQNSILPVKFTFI